MPRITVYPRIKIALVRGLSSKALNIDVIAYVLPAVVNGLEWR
jgi:hypothetical protein